MSLPTHFCWTRFGTEAAQSIHQILRRKEEERLANDGMFFWGIGNAVGPSMKELLRRSDEPEVLFSPIKSAARLEDSAPAAVVAWTSGETLDGDLFRLPDHSLVTSRFDLERPRGTHYALVCFSDEPLRLAASGEKIIFNEMKNILTGKPVGASQVTSIVQRVEEDADQASRSYDISIRARLVAPYFIRLQDPLPVKTSESGFLKGANWADAVRQLWDQRVSGASPQLAL